MIKNKFLKWVLIFAWILIIVLCAFIAFTTNYGEESEKMESRDYYSQAYYDGWLLETTETTDSGGTRNNKNKAIRLGDDASDRQYIAILSFNTEGLPDDAEISSALLKIKKASQEGGNPFDTLGPLWADMISGEFSSNPDLQLDDFSAASSRQAAGEITGESNSSWYTLALSSENFVDINRTGVTQFRLRFERETNDNGIADVMTFFSGDEDTTANRPTLTVEYTVP